MQFLKYNDIFAVLSTVCLALFWTQYQQLKSDLKYEANLLNKTHQSNESIVIFNRVPKCGSESLHKIMEILSAKNNFTVYDDEHTKKGVEITYLAEKSDRKAFVDMFYKEPNLKLPCVYTKHANFLEFEEFLCSQEFLCNKDSKLTQVRFIWSKYDDNMTNFRHIDISYFFPYFRNMRINMKFNMTKMDKYHIV